MSLQIIVHLRIQLPEQRDIAVREREREKVRQRLRQTERDIEIERKKQRNREIKRWVSSPPPP